MAPKEQPAELERKTEQLTRRAQDLGLEIEPEQLSALAKQLSLIEALEAADLDEVQPILKMDAGWDD